MKQFRPFWFSIASLILLVAGGVWTWVSLKGKSGPFILHITKADGITQIGTVRDLIAIWIFGLLLVGVNSMLVETLNEREPLWSLILGAAGLTCATLLFIALGAIISLN